MKNPSRLMSRSKHLCLAVMMLLLIPLGAQAQVNNTLWQPRQIAIAPDGTTRELWVKAGLRSEQLYSYTGDTATVWSLNAQGQKTNIGPVYGPFPGWHAEQLTVAADGTLRLLWENENEVAGGGGIALWTLDAQGKVTSIGPYYATTGVSVGYGAIPIAVLADGSARLLTITPQPEDHEDNTGTVSLWSLNAQGQRTKIGPTYGPYPGWTIVPQLGAASDGTLRVLWVKPGSSGVEGSYSGDTIALWSFDTQGNVTTIGPTHGPFMGAYAYQLATLPDGTSRVLWSIYTQDAYGNSSGPAQAVWSLDNQGRIAAIGPSYGPYPGWFLQQFTTAPDGTSRFLWEQLYYSSEMDMGDTISLWSLDSSGRESAIGPSYGPYRQWWYSNQLVVAPDGSSRLFWDYCIDPNVASILNGSQSSVWSINVTGRQTAIGPSYGPYQ